MKLDAPSQSSPSPATGGRPFPVAVERAVGRLQGPLGWMWNRGFRFLFVLDALGLFTTMVAINLVRFGWHWPDYPRGHYWVGFGAATAIHLAINYFAGLYEREPRLGYRPWFPRVAMATVIAVGFDGLAALISDRYLMPRLNLAVFLVLASLGLTANRSIARLLAVRRQGPPRVLLVGTGAEVELTREQFARSSDVTVCATVATIDDVLAAAVGARATDVLLLELSAFEAAFPYPLLDLDDRGIGVHQRVSGRDTLLGLQTVREIAGMPFTRIRTHAMAAHQLRLKRLFDLGLLTISAPLMLLVLGVLALYVRAYAGSGVIYRQTRVGLWGREFEVYKFRTMVPNAEEGGPQLSSVDDPRVIPALRWMRSTRADELPQLRNVLRGNMSLVGPRPERPEFVAEIETTVPGYDRRHELPPGLTGLAQVHGRYHTDPRHKLGYDLQYIVNWSLVLDLQILLRTVLVVLMRRV